MGPTVLARYCVRYVVMAMAALDRLRKRKAQSLSEAVIVVPSTIVFFAVPSTFRVSENTKVCGSIKKRDRRGGLHHPTANAAEETVRVVGITPWAPDRIRAQGRAAFETATQFVGHAVDDNRPAYPSARGPYAARSESRHVPFTPMPFCTSGYSAISRWDVGCTGT